MNKLWKFLWDRKWVYLLYIIIIGIFCLVLFLYDMMGEAVYYATLLSVVLLLVVVIVDFYGFYQKDKYLEHIMSLEYIDIGDLPVASTFIEQHYQQLLNEMQILHQTLENQYDESYQEMIDYFTLWVHQIKIPIAAIRLLIQSQDYHQNDLLVQILKIEQYVDMALHYIKMKHMSSDLQIKEYALGDIVDEVIKKEAIFFIQKRIKLDKQPIESMILTDEKWISFVIEQILSNALKYTKEGKISIYEKDKVLYIEDTGIGIKEEDLPRVFEKGFTGYNGRLDKKASGLGLYLCKQIMDNLGYQIHIQSVVNQGTIVSLDFHVDSLVVE